jgi:hypothetical protein
VVLRLHATHTPYVPFRHHPNVLPPRINAAMNYTEPERKVREATNPDEPWGPHGQLMSEIAAMTYRCATRPPPPPATLGTHPHPHSAGWS